MRCQCTCFGLLAAYCCESWKSKISNANSMRFLNDEMRRCQREKKTNVFILDDSLGICWITKAQKIPEGQMVQRTPWEQFINNKFRHRENREPLKPLKPARSCTCLQLYCRFSQPWWSGMAGQSNCGMADGSGMSFNCNSPQGVIASDPIVLSRSCPYPSSTHQLQ